MSKIHAALIDANAPILVRAMELLAYDGETGIFTRRLSTGGRAAGSVAGGARKDGYLQIAVDGQMFLAHRLAWLFVNGSFPKCQVDHIDGRKTNNAISNLREASPLLNQQNKRAAYKNSKTGLLGACWCKRRGLFVARINVDGRRRLVGYYKTADEAHARYIEAKRRLHEGNTL